MYRSYRRIVLITMLAIATLSCKQKHELTFANPLQTDRTDEVLVLSREQINSVLNLDEGFWPVIKLANGELVPVQVDDLNKDGEWDELAVLLDFTAGEKKTVYLDQVLADNYPEFEKRTNLRLGIIQDDGTFKEVDRYRALPCDTGFKIIAQAESVSWENDKMAFRVYFDCRNVKDLFGKLKPDLIVDKVQTDELGSYHELADWGMDILHCGSSLGAGGLALLKNDSLYRLGSTAVYEYQKITEGPVRSVFELRYEGWEVDGDDLQAVERISVYPGKYWFKSEVTLSAHPENSEIATGIVTSLLKRDPFQFEAPGFQCIGTHDVQSLNNDELGMAVLVPLQEAGKIGRSSDTDFFKLGYKTVEEKNFSNIISETYYIGQKYKAQKAAPHYFFAVWGLDDQRWKTEEGFREYVAGEAGKLASPIRQL